jgi:hypothetical protein
VTFALQSIVKDAGANFLAITYQLSPVLPASGSQLNWSSIVSQTSNLDLNFTGFNYNAATGSLVVDMTYQQDVDTANLALSFNFPNEAPYNQLGVVNVSTTLTTTNNLSLQTFTPGQYEAAGMLQYIAIALAALGFLFFLFGYYSGRLIALELVVMYQLTYYSLLALDNLSPSFNALMYLGYSSGYHISLFS